jgi:hypothetical protein
MEDNKVNAVAIAYVGRKLCDESIAEVFPKLLAMHSDMVNHNPLTWGFAKGYSLPTGIKAVKTGETTIDRTGWFGMKYKETCDTWVVFLVFDNKMERDSEEHRFWKAFAAGHISARCSFHKWTCF